jgi:putative endonuclease
MSICTTRQKGQHVESQVAVYLQQQGLRLIEKNFTCKQGEIDLIFQAADLLICVEVRYRNNSHFCHPLETIGYAKQKKVIAAAKFFVHCKQWAQALTVRFDIVSVTGPADRLQFEWIPDAFQVQYGFC